MLVRYAIVEGEKVVNITEAEEGFTYPGMTFVQMPDGIPIGPGWDYIDGQFSEPVPEPVPEVNYGTKITKLAFRLRFTPEEKVTLVMASLDDPSAPQQSRLLAATLRTYQKDVETATYIDLSREDTRTGVQSLETYGLLGTGRASEILDTPIRYDELPLELQNRQQQRSFIG
jgi:hypothetical protein